MLKLLPERGADVNASDQHGNTALMEAASKGCGREALKILQSLLPSLAESPFRCIA